MKSWNWIKPDSDSYLVHCQICNEHLGTHEYCWCKEQKVVSQGLLMVELIGFHKSCLGNIVQSAPRESWEWDEIIKEKKRDLIMELKNV